MEGEMNDLEKIRQMAQSEANRCGRPMAILNLNRFNALYVVREVPKPVGPYQYKDQLVEIVNPVGAVRGNPASMEG
jgi:hypothetical protein